MLGIITLPAPRTARATPPPMKRDKVKIFDMSETIGRRGYPEDDERAIKILRPQKP